MIKRICPICEQVMESRHYCRECRSFVRHPRVIDVDYYLNERHSGQEKGCEYHNPSFMNRGIASQAGTSKFPKRTEMAGQTGTRQTSRQTGNRAGNWLEGSRPQSSHTPAGNSPQRTGNQGRNQFGGNQFGQNQAGRPGGKNGNVGLVVAAVVIIIFFLNLILPFLMFAI